MASSADTTYAMRDVRDESKALHRVAPDIVNRIMEVIGEMEESSLDRLRIVTNLK